METGFVSALGQMLKRFALVCVRKRALLQLNFHLSPEVSSSFETLRSFRNIRQWSACCDRVILPIIHHSFEADVVYGYQVHKSRECYKQQRIPLVP